MEQQPKIADRCPSCGHQSLFIGEGGWITCGNLSTCKEPGLTHYLRALRERDEKRMERDQPFIDGMVELLEFLEAPLRESLIGLGPHLGHPPNTRVEWFTGSDNVAKALHLLEARRARREGMKHGE